MARKIVRGGLVLIVGLSVAAFLLLAVAPRTGWYRPLTVLSGSMEPTFSAGDLIIVRPQPLRDVRAGQVISFHVPTGAKQVETHRVIRVIHGGANPIVETRGDANDRLDPWRAELHGTTAWRLGLVVPYGGYAIKALRGRTVHLAAVFVAPALLALLVLAQLWEIRLLGRPRLRASS
jgi:signal peptidase